MIKIYGSPKSSAGRCFLMLEECGRSYEVMPINMAEKEHKSEQYLKLNPNGKIPCMIEDDFILWESAAIVQYLAQKYQPEMLGTTVQDKSLVQQWSYWTMTEAQPPLVDILIQTHFVPEQNRDNALIARREKQLPNILTVLNKELEGKKFLVGNNFSVADLMTGSAINIAAGLKIDLSAYPNVKAWHAELNARPAWRKIAELRS